MNAPLAPTTPPPKKKTRWFRWVLLTFLVLLLVALWVAPGVLAKSSFKDKLIADLTADVSGTVRVGEVSLNWLHPVTAFDLSVTDDAGKPVLSAKKVSTSKTLLDFVLNRRDLGTLRIEQPAAEIAFENGTTNVQRVFAKYLEPGDGKTSPRPAVAIELTDGTVKLADVASDRRRADRR
ncbi:MAG: hypothetical protein MUF18_20230 [Fimbriiglobus sp.]|nr:hypothetical protein [Fimbriiglobus sp.]